MSTHYQLLAVRPDASIDEVRRAYHQLARDNHPDRFREPDERRLAEERFAAMTEAFNVLSDNTRRQEYDTKLREEASGDTVAQREARSYFRAATVKLQENQFNDAVRLLKAAIHLEPEPATYYAHLARAYEQAGSYGDAARMWDEALKRESFNVKYLRLAGQCLEKAGMRIRARKMYESVLKWDKSDTVAAEALRRLDGEGSKKGGLLSGLFRKS